jgi:hypothetical protein
VLAGPSGTLRFLVKGFAGKEKEKETQATKGPLPSDTLETIDRGR